MNYLRILSIVALAFFISCGGSDDSSAPMTDDMGQDPQSAANLIISFNIPASENNLPIPADVQTSGNAMKIFFPPNSDRSAIRVNFQLSPGAMMLVGSTEIISGETPINFNSDVALKVVADNGDENVYQVASEANFNTLDNAIESLRNQYSAPGFQVAIVKDERLVYANGYGKADLQNQEDVTDASVFRVASVSKPITVIAILKLVQDGVLNLSDTVFGVNGLLENDFGTPPYGNNIELITVKHLLDHTSGWTNDPFDPMFANITWTQKQVIDDMLNNRPLVTQPGETYYYSNFGYLVLGRIVEKVTGSAYDTYLKQDILSPAGISTMEIANNSITEKWPNEVEYFSQENFNPYTQMNTHRMDSHGGWVSNAKDLARLLVLVDGGNKVADILDSSTLSNSYIGFNDWWFAGSLPGTSTVVGKMGSGYQYIILTNTRPATDIFEIITDMQALMQSRIESRSSWPNYDLF